MMPYCETSERRRVARVDRMYREGMKRVVQWMAREAAERGSINSRFDIVGTRHVFDAGWAGGKVVVSAEEAAATRHTLYLIYLLSWATTVPMLLILAIMSLSQMRPIVHVAFFGFILVAAYLLVTMGNLLQYPYMAMVARGKPSFEPEEVIAVRTP